MYHQSNMDAWGVCQGERIFCSPELLVRSILNHIDTRETLSGMKGSCMTCRPSWYQNPQKKEIRI